MSVVGLNSFFLSFNIIHIDIDLELRCMCAAVPPQKPKNLSCVTTDLATVTCSWASGRKRDPQDRNKQTNTLHIQ